MAIDLDRGDSKASLDGGNDGVGNRFIEMLSADDTKKVCVSMGFHCLCCPVLSCHVDHVMSCLVAENTIQLSIPN